MTFSESRWRRYAEAYKSILFVLAYKLNIYAKTHIAKLSALAYNELMTELEYLLAGLAASSIVYLVTVLVIAIVWTIWDSIQ